MDRLTIRNSDGSVSQPTHSTIEKIFNRLAAYEDTGLTPEEIEIYIGLFTAECEGRLNILPCKVGNTVFVVIIGNILPLDVISIEFYSDKPRFKGQHGIHLIWEFGEDDIGKTVFLTRAEAEAALKGGSNEAN